jgi:hypothetical protein
MGAATVEGRVVAIWWWSSAGAPRSKVVEGDVVVSAATR